MRSVPGPDRRGAGLRVVIAPDAFKGSLSAIEVCNAIKRGVLAAAPEADVDLCPLADGGEGTAQTIAAGHDPTDVTVVPFDVCGPLPDTVVQGRVTLIDGGLTGLIDMADAAGLQLLARKDYNPVRTTSYGVGELIRYAADAGCRRIIVGAGGSATTDGGLGAAQALGVRFETADGPLERPITGGDLASLTHVEVPIVGLRSRVSLLCDVNNPLLGPNGTAAMFSAQRAQHRSRSSNSKPASNTQLKSVCEKPQRTSRSWVRLAGCRSG